LSDAAHKSLHGTWHGTIQFGNAPIDIVLRIDTSGPETRGLSDFPQHRRADLPLRELVAEGGTLHFTTRSFGEYAGTLTADASRIEGRFIQDDKQHELVLHAGAPVEKSSERPQTPKPPFAYSAQDIRVDSHTAGCRLAGILTIPDNVPVRAVALLITGSGAMDRDETIFGHKPFWVLADFLSRRGYAALRLDDRGVGESSGERTSITLNDETDDMAAALDFLAICDELRGMPIGVIGHSMGGLIATTLAARRNDVAFVITMGTPGMSLGEAFAERECAELEKAGASSQTIENHREFTRALHQWLGKNPDIPMDAQRYSALAKQFDAQHTAVPRSNAEWIDRFNTPWFRSAARLQPADALQRLASPLLAINGSLDVQSTAASNLAATAHILGAAGHTDFTTIELAGLNHLFQTCTTGAVYEYPVIEETFSPLALQTIGAWLESRFERSAYKSANGFGASITGTSGSRSRGTTTADTARGHVSSIDIPIASVVPTTSSMPISAGPLVGHRARSVSKRDHDVMRGVPWRRETCDSHHPRCTRHDERFLPPTHQGPRQCQPHRRPFRNALP
jgi:pimeloyl-ACP methyl ester carboxylesterase